MTYGIMEILYVLFPCIPLHPNCTTSFILFLLIYDQHIAIFICSCYGDLYAIVVLRVAYYRPI